MDIPRHSILAFLIICSLASGVFSRTCAVCTMVVNSALPDAEKEDITGTIHLYQDSDSSDLELHLSISGFKPTSSVAKHGFHIHTEGLSASNDCDSIGGHYNPDNVNHGGPKDEIRHVGDLGNIEVSTNGTLITTKIIDTIAKITGDRTAVGRGIDIHSGEDDLGKSGGNGGSGSRLACCEVKLVTHCPANSAQAREVSICIVFLSLLTYIVGILSN